MYYNQKRYYIKSWAFNFFWQKIKICKAKRVEAIDNRTRAYWAFMQGTNEALFLLFV